MHATAREGRSKVLRSAYLEVKGLGLVSRFTRQWVCLTEGGLRFYKDPTCAVSKPNSVIPYHTIKSSVQDILRPSSIRLDLPSKAVFLEFKTPQELKIWLYDLEALCHPVLQIGEDSGLVSDDGSEEHTEDPTPTSDDKLCKGQELRNAQKINRESFATEAPSEASTLLNRSSFFSQRDSRHCSTLTTSTRVDKHSSWGTHPWVSDCLTKSWPDLSDLLTSVENEFSEDAEERSCSPIDPDLVFEPGHVFLSVSESPRPRKDTCGLMDLTGEVTKLDQFPFATGGFADVWRGEWEAEDGCKIVAMKVLRSFSQDQDTDEKVQKRLKKELDIWVQLRHCNIIPLYGIVHDLGRYASMVSPWMHKGNASRYFEGMDVFNTMPAKLKLLCQVAAGLEYLHCFKPCVVHGDLKAANILINDNDDALLSDFGVSAVIEEASGTSGFASSSFAGSVRWMAFELFRVGDSAPQPTTHSDVWSFGSTVLEVLSGKVPYHHRKNDVQVLHEIMLLGLRPRNEDSVPVDVWTFLQTCWKDDPSSRPSISLVRETMNKMYRKSKRMGMEMDL